MFRGGVCVCGGRGAVPGAVGAGTGSPGLPQEELSLITADFPRWSILNIDLINKQPAGSIKMLFCISITAH